MAIVIPSKYIYDNPNDNKINENEINKLEVQTTNVAPKNEYDIPVYNEKITRNFMWREPIKKKQVDIGIGQIPPRTVAYVQVTLNTKGNHFVSMDYNTGNNSYISKIYTGTNKDGEPNIHFSIYGTVEKGNVTAEYSDDVTNIQLSTPTETYTQFYTLPNSISAELTANGATATATLDVDVYGNLATVVPNEDESGYYMSLNITTGAELIKLTGSGGGTSTVELSGTYERYTPEYVDLTINGNTIGINLEDKTVIVGNTNGTNPISFKNNELLQNSNYINDNSTVKNAIDTMFTDTLNHYKDGKETISLLCSISNYYDTDKTLKISPDNGSQPMTFNIYDRVIPMKFTSDGVDVPMAKNADGTAKEFIVLSVKPFYNGAVWQELFLQEA